MLMLIGKVGDDLQIFIEKWGSYKINVDYFKILNPQF